MSSSSRVRALLAAFAVAAVAANVAVGLVTALAHDLAPEVRVNAVAPGMVWTPRVSAYVGEEGRRNNELNTPLRRVALPEDIAAALLFMVSDLSGYVNGQTLVVDGGSTIGAGF